MDELKGSLVKTKPSEPKTGIVTQIVRMIFMLVFSLIGANQLIADDPPQMEQSTPPIQITADRLISFGSKNHAEFIGKVKVVQGETIIHSDRLKLFYLSGTSQQDTINTGDIETIEAIGNVRIEFDNRVAVGQKAVYSTIERKLVLTGPGAKITEGADKVEGDMITFYRNDGRIDINGDVRMQIRSTQRGLN